MHLFHPCTYALWLQVRSQHGILSKKDFKLLNQSLGLNYTPHGVLFDVELRRYFKPISILQYDWLHCLLVQGIFPHEINLALAELKSVGFGQKEIHAWLKLG